MKEQIRLQLIYTTLTTYYYYFNSLNFWVGDWGQTHQHIHQHFTITNIIQFYQNNFRSTMTSEIRVFKGLLNFSGYASFRQTQISLSNNLFDSRSGSTITTLSSFRSSDHDGTAVGSHAQWVVVQCQYSQFIQFPQLVPFAKFFNVIPVQVQQR